MNPQSVPAVVAKAHFAVFPYAEVNPNSKLHADTTPMFGSIAPYSHDDPGESGDADSVITVGALASTLKVCSMLRPPGLPKALGCVATAVYSPFGSGADSFGELHSPPSPSAV